MAPFVSITDLRARDEIVKNGPELNQESINLTDIYLGRGKDLTLQWLRAMGQGDETNRQPFQTKLLRRLVHTTSTIWSNPPVRRLTLDGATLPDTEPTVELVSRIYQRSQFNAYLKSLDRWRTLLGQAVAYLSPPNPARPERMPMRIFQPHNVLRDPNDVASDDMSMDQRVAFLVHQDDRQPTHSIYHYWEQVNPGEWVAFRVYANGELVDDDDSALYPNGTVPFEGAPFLCVYDELPEGRAWVPIDGTRTAFSLASNVVMNDLLYLLKQEAHTVIGVSGLDNQSDLPKRWGAGEMWGFEGTDVRLHPLALNPKLAESITVSRHLSEIFAAGEGLPADYFLATRKFETGAAGRLRNQDLDARRQDQSQDAIETELQVFDMVRRLWNEISDGGPGIGADYDMTVELGRQWFPVNLPELQQTYAFDLSIGACSVIDYLMERYRYSREQAIDFYNRVQIDRNAYVLRENPAALIAGRNPAMGPGSATPLDPEAEVDEALAGDVQPDSSSMNPNRAASNEEGSTVGAARKALSL